MKETKDERQMTPNTWKNYMLFHDPLCFWHGHRLDADVDASRCTCDQIIEIRAPQDEVSRADERKLIVQHFEKEMDKLSKEIDLPLFNKIISILETA